MVFVPDFILELYMYATLFLLIALLTYSLFFLGGAIMCYGIGFKHSRSAKKARSTLTDRQEGIPRF
jgi:hypothetical protein